MSLNIIILLAYAVVIKTFNTIHL